MTTDRTAKWKKKDCTKKAQAISENDSETARASSNDPTYFADFAASIAAS